MERGEIRGGIDASRQSRIALRSIQATLAAYRHGRTCSGHPRLWFDAHLKDVDARDLGERSDGVLLNGYARA